MAGPALRAGSEAYRHGTESQDLYPYHLPPFSEQTSFLVLCATKNNYYMEVPSPSWWLW